MASDVTGHSYDVSIDFRSRGPREVNGSWKQEKLLLKNIPVAPVWWHAPLVSTWETQAGESLRIEASLIYIVSFRLSRPT